MEVINHLYRESDSYQNDLEELLFYEQKHNFKELAGLSEKSFINQILIGASTSKDEGDFERIQIIKGYLGHYKEEIALNA